MKAKFFLSVFLLTTIIPVAYGQRDPVITSERCGGEETEEETRACRQRQRARESRQRRDHYRSYTSVGFCVPYVGRECLDYHSGYGYGTIAVHSRISARGDFCTVREYLTSRGERREELVMGVNCIYRE